MQKILAINEVKKGKNGANRWAFIYGRGKYGENGAPVLHRASFACVPY